MNREEFLAAIRERLAGLPLLDVERAVEYYNEAINDRLEDGVPEEEAVAAMGTVDEAVAQILADTSLPKLIRATTRPTRALRTWEIVLLILGSPVWVPLLLTALIIVLSVYIVIWSVVLSFYAVDLSLAIGGIGLVATGGVFGFTARPVQTLFAVGGGLVCVGLSILLFFGCNQVTIGIVKLSRWFMRWVKSLFIRKKGAK